MILGFTGSRIGMSFVQTGAVRLLVSALKFDEAHHGDCVGADQEFHDIVRELKPDVKIVIHPPINETKRAFCEGDETREKRPYLERNRNIVRKCTVLLGCPGQMKELKRSGTWTTIRNARSIGRHRFTLLPHNMRGKDGSK